MLRGLDVGDCPGKGYTVATKSMHMKVPCGQTENQHPMFSSFVAQSCKKFGTSKIIRGDEPMNFGTSLRH